MTQGPEGTDPQDPTAPVGDQSPQEQSPESQPPAAPQPGQYAPPPPPPPPTLGQAPYAQYGAMAGPAGQPGAPYGVHPMTGIPYSDKTKLIAGILQILLPFGVGRFYVGDTKIGVIQLLVTFLTCGVGALWPFIDGIIYLATDSKDANGYMLR